MVLPRFVTKSAGLKCPLHTTSTAFGCHGFLVTGSLRLIALSQAFRITLSLGKLKRNATHKSQLKINHGL
jgi:hypothetical protein